MSVRMRHTRSHTKNRRSHHALSATTLVKDTERDSVHLPHRLDEKTGMYRGKQIISNDELKRREQRTKSKQAAHASNAEQPALENVREPMHTHSEESQPAGKQGKEGLLGRFTKGRAQARSGTGS